MNPYQQRMQELEAEFIREREGIQPFHLSDEQLVAAQAELGCQFPEDYKTFLRDFGCYMLYCVYPVLTSAVSRGDISLFYGVTPPESHPLPFDSTVDLVRQNRSVFSGWLPVGFLVIGDSTGSSFTCLAVSGSDSGSVFFWDRIESWDASNYKGLYKVASSFDQFMSFLTVDR